MTPFCYFDFDNFGNPLSANPNKMIKHTGVVA